MFRHYRSHLPAIRRTAIILALVVFVVASLGVQQVARADGITVITTASVNLRSGPTTAAIVMAKIPRGTIMSALARNNNVSWILVRAGNVDGWIASVFLVSAGGDLGSLPLGAGTGVPNNPANGTAANDVVTGITATAVVTMNIRGGPGLKYPIIGKLRTGQTVALSGRVGFWLRFRFADGKRAWVHSSLVIISGGSIDDLPEVSPAGT